MTDANGDGELLVTGEGVVPVRTSVGRVPRAAADLPAGPLRERVGRLLDVRSLLPTIEVRTHCRRLVLADDEGKTCVELDVHDDVSVVTPEATSVAAVLVEVRALTGYAGQAARLRDELAARGWSAVDGDVTAAAAALVGVDLRGFDSNTHAELDRDQPAFEGFRAVLADLAATIEANLPGTIDHLDPEFLHDFRIAVRRTRSILGHGGGVVPADVRAWARESFRELGAVTGPSRDLDVQVLEWDDLVEPFDADTRAALEPVRSLLVRRRAEAHAELSAALGDRACTDALGRWQAWLDDPGAVGGRRADDRLGDVVATRIERAQRRLLRDGRAIDDDSPATALHELRKDAKKLRYAFECFEGILPNAPRKRFVKRLKRLQDLLGEHQDAEVHAEQLVGVARELHEAGESADTLLAVGRLVEVQQHRCREMRAGFARAFAAYDDDRTERALTQVVEKLRR